MPDGLLLSKDLFFTTKVCDTARAVDLTIQVVQNLNQLTEYLDQHLKVIFFDLENLTIPVEDVMPVQADQEIQTIAFGSHVNRKQLQAARDLGVDRVMPRSQFSSQLSSILQEFVETD